MNTQETLLAALRGRFGDSQTAVADALGISQQRLSNYMRGQRRMDDDAVIACCELLGWSAAKYVAAHRAEIASTSREIAFWKKLAARTAVLVVMLGAIPLPGHAQDGRDGPSVRIERHILLLMSYAGCGCACVGTFSD